MVAFPGLVGRWSYYPGMASVIDPETHAHLIAVQLTVLERFHTLETWTGDDAERPALREAAGEAVLAKDRALRESGLVAEHGYYVASQDLKNAAREAAA